MLDSLLDTVSLAGSMADKMGPRPLRGLLAGRPREALSFIPFSDTLGITDPNQVASGRDVTNRLGVTSAADRSFGASALGYGAEALLDPLGLAGGAAAGIGAAKGLSRMSPPGSSGHFLASLLGDQNATSMLRDTSPLSRQRWSAQNRRGFIGFDIPGLTEGTRKAADYVGPQYNPESGRDLITKALTYRRDRFPSAPAMPLESRLSANPEIDRILSEIPEGSSVLGAGGQALVFRAPQSGTNPGWAVRLSPSVDSLTVSPEEFMREFNGNLAPIAGRPRIPEMLAPLRSNDFGSDLASHGVRVEHLPLVEPLGDNTRAIEDLMAEAVSDPFRKIPYQHLASIHQRTSEIKDIDKALASYLKDAVRDGHPGLNPFDVHPGNIGLIGNRIAVHDGGAIGGIGTSVLPYPSAPRPPEDFIQAALRGNAPQAMRGALANAAASPLGQGVEAPRNLQGTMGRVYGDPIGQRQENLQVILDFIKKFGLEDLASNLITPSAASPAANILKALGG